MSGRPTESLNCTANCTKPGLGLSIVAQAITRHGGWVKAGHSAQGGAEFTVSLPGSTAIEGLAQQEPTLL